jgi:XRN 5'-3' exonuclease N-terminus/Xrn1 helical domain
MGIPQFARYILHGFGHHVGRGPPPASGSSSPSACSSCTRLFLDFNGTIHESARDVIAAAAAGAAASTTGMEPAIIRETLARLEGRVRKMRPSDMVVVAIDGVPPRAKMQQQRYRRFMSVWLKENCPTSGNPGAAAQTWDTNAITPGTAFMAKLANALTAEAPAMERRLGVKIVFSGPDVPGEGEQKIFGFLRANPDPTAIDLVYGLDADLILQALLYHSHTLGRTDDCQSNCGSGGGGIWIARETSPDADDMTYIDIRQLHEGLRRRFAGCTAEDFALLCCFVGNDFMPRLPSLSISDGGIDALMQARQAALGGATKTGPGNNNSNRNKMEGRSIVCPRTGRIDGGALLAVLDAISTAEEGALRAAERKHAAAREKLVGRYNNGTSRTQNTRDDRRRCKGGQQRRPDDEPSLAIDLPLLRPFPDVVSRTAPAGGRDTITTCCTSLARRNSRACARRTCRGSSGPSATPRSAASAAAGTTPTLPPPPRWTSTTMRRPAGATWPPWRRIWPHWIRFRGPWWSTTPSCSCSWSFRLSRRPCSTTPGVRR